MEKSVAKNKLGGEKEDWKEKKNVFDVEKVVFKSAKSTRLKDYRQKWTKKKKKKL